MAAEVSMTKGSIARQMIFFAVPIFLGELFQQLYNTADSFIVGNFAGPESLAAVASSMSLIQLLVGFFNGMAMGASVVISQSFGAQNYKKMSEVIHSTVLMGIVISIVLTAIGMWATPSILEWMGTPADVMDLSVDYLEIIFAGMTGLVMYNLFSGIMRAVGDSKTPLYFLIFTSILNCVLDVIFVAGFGWGVKGAGWATILCQFLSALLAGIVLMRCEGPHRIDLVKIRFYPGPMWEVIRFGFPTAVQNCIISFANVFVQSNINAFGSSAMAGSG
ncbi:MAG: MATE family efflux transporter, partial [Erysipelotrichaceae bacterium]|nr:MATE family efflux transporter [Erysipelotrichaceae bacterium]